MKVTEDTRARLLEAAGTLFAEAGYERVTVREICRLAGANVAAVNYHFGDKLGLYSAVILAHIRFPQEAAAASQSGPPENQLRTFVHTYLQGLVAKDRPEWVARLTALEMTRPSPVLDRVVDEILRPTEARLCRLIAAITDLPEGDDRVRMAAHSVVGQCLHYRHAENVLARLWPHLWSRGDRLQILADHIYDFSLAGIRKLRDEHRRTRAGRKKA